MIFRETPIAPEIQIGAVHTAFIKTYSNYVFLGETHPMWELSYFISGECIITTGSGVFRAVPGMLVLHSPHLLHGLNSEKSAVSIMTISFTCDGPAPFLRGGQFKAGDREKSLLALLEQEVLKTRHTPRDLTVLKALLESLLLVMTEKKQPAGQKPLSAETQAFSELVHYMEQNVRNGIRMRELQDISHRCATAIRNIFHKYAGMGPMEYYNALRLSGAKSLLEQGMTVSEVSDEMNFSSPCYFSNFFKERAGVSPAEYKKRLKAN